MFRNRIVRIAGLILALASGHATAQLGTLVAHYPFEGNVEEAENAHLDGTATGSPRYLAGVAGRAVDMDGSDDELRFAALSNTTFHGSFTLTWFMNIAQYDSYSLFGKRDGCTASNYFASQVGTAAGSDRLGFILSNGATTVTAEAPIRAGTWVHIALVRDASARTARVYVDGKPGNPVALPTLDYRGVSAAFGLGNSGCIVTLPRNYTRPKGRFDELRLYASALSQTDIATLAKRPLFSATPATASPDVISSVAATGLLVDRNYSLRLVGGAVNQIVASGVATGSRMTWRFTVPNVPAAAYRLQLLSGSTLRPIVERELTFRVVAPLSVAVSTVTPKAGKSLAMSVSGLASGALRLRYAGRVVYGPVTVDEPTQVLKFIAPTDIPATFPANVTLRAELLDGRSVARVGEQNIDVSAPFTGTFLSLSNLSSSRTNPTPRERVEVSGNFTLRDGTTPQDMDFSAYWIGDDGSVTPLPTDALTFAGDGNVRLATRPPSLGAMSSLIPRSSGHVRLIGRRMNPVTGRPETQIVDGPAMTTMYDTDPQTDITIRVRANVGGGNTVALEGAYAVLDPAAPVQAFEPPPPDPATGESGYATPGSGLRGHAQPGLTLSAAQSAPVNQVTAALGMIATPLPDCGTNLYRRITDAEGRAEFPIQGGSEEQPTTFQNLDAMSFTPTACTGVGCGAVQVQPVYTFYLSVYTLHLGAGYRQSNNTNAEAPSRFKITYDRSIEQFTIKDLRSGIETVQNVSANITITVPQIGQSSGVVTISDPLMVQGVGTYEMLVPRIGETGFGPWIDFTGTAVSEFLNAAPTRRIQFGHRPDFNGSLVSAKLYLKNLSTGNPSFIGDFRQTSFIEGCNLQDDPAMNAAEHWRLDLPDLLGHSWRFPQGVFYNNEDRKACGYIEVINTAGSMSRRNICFHWAEPPSSLGESGSGALVVDDTRVDQVLIELQGDRLNTQSTQIPKRDNEFFGEPVNLPDDMDNDTNSSRSLFQIVSGGEIVSEAREFRGNNPQQFSRGAAGASNVGSLSPGTTVLEIGDNEFKTVLDETIPLFQWYWGVPEILSAEVYARLRLLAQYYYHGSLRKTPQGEELDLVTDALFGVGIMIGVDIDVLFGLIIDAGASLTGMVVSEMPTVIENGTLQNVGPCFTFRLDFDGFVDPCAMCPTPVIEFGGNLFDESSPSNCSFWDGRPKGSDLVSLRKSASPTMGAAEMRALRRHPTLAFGAVGNGQMAMVAGDNTLKMSVIESGVAGATTTLSTAPGIRQPKLAYFDDDRAVSVWFESAMTVQQYTTVTAATYVDNARAQRLAWSEWDGETWTGKRYITLPGKGEGHVAMAACRDGTAGCPAGGEVTIVWQRNESGDAKHPQYRLYHARYVPGGDWSVPAIVASAANVQDITPDVTYVGAQPVVVWVRQAGTSLDAHTQRQLAYRMLPAGAAAVIANLPNSPVAPTVVAGPAGGAQLRIAYVRPEDGEGLIGTQLALHVASGQCSGTTCSFSGARVRDPSGRSIYGERPRLLKLAGSDASIVMRGFRFEGENGQPVQSGDAIGTILSSGDLLSITPNFTTGIARVVPITADGAVHFGHTAAYDPTSDQVFTMAATFVPQTMLPMRAALKASGHKGHISFSKSMLMTDGIELRAMAAAPDLMVESLQPSATLPSPNASMTATVRVGNRGTSYVATRDGVVLLRLRWNDAAGVAIASVGVPDVAAGESVDLVVNFTAPSNAHADEPHELHARLELPSDLDELDGSNNAATHVFAGLPVPQHLASSIQPGVSTVQLGWDAIDDGRVAGFRVYRENEFGDWVPMGASPVHGFLDLSSTFNVARRYAVSSYSSRGIESARSAPVTAMPLIAEAPGATLLSDGFEDLSGAP